MNDSSEVVDFVSNHHIGDPVTITASRGGDARTFNARLIEAPSLDNGGETPKFGLMLQTLTHALADSLGLPPDTHGVAVTDVQADGPADRGGLRVGDVIVEIDHKPILTDQDAAAMLKTGPKHLLRVRGSQGFRFVGLNAE